MIIPSNKTIGEVYGYHHNAFIKVHPGGSCCANCAELAPDRKNCMSKHFIKANGGKSRLPDDIENWCSDFYEPMKTDAVPTKGLAMTKS